MKKALVLALTVVLTLACSVLTMASTMKVNVDEGFKSVYVGFPDIDENGFDIIGNYAVDGQLLVYAGLTIDNKYSGKDGILLGARYELQKNLAAALDCSEDWWGISLLGKHNYSKQLDFTGKLAYNSYDGDFSDITIVGQAEYAVDDRLVPTIGLKMVRTSWDGHSDSDSGIILGLDFYASKEIRLYLDCELRDNDVISIGAEYVF